LGGQSLRSIAGASGRFGPASSDRDGGSRHAGGAGGQGGDYDDSEFALLLQRGEHFCEPVEDNMPTFILTLNWTEQGIRAVKDAPKRSQAAKELAKKLGVEIKQVYLTSGEHDLLLIVESASGDNVAKFALATGALGNVRTSTTRAWPEPEFQK